jgi:hypothetical protein
MLWVEQVQTPYFELRTKKFNMAVGREWRALQLFHAPTLCKGNTLPDLCKGMHRGHRALYLSVFFPTETNGVNCAEDYSGVCQNSV